MASRRSKDKSLAIDNQIVKREPTSSLQTANQFTTLGTIPKPNYSTVLALSYDPYALTPVHQPVGTAFPRNASQYVKKQYFQNLFSIEPNKASIVDPLKLAKSYFPPKIHWILEHGEKNLQYYSNLLCHEKSIIINTISDKVYTSKIIYHSVYIVNEFSNFADPPIARNYLPNQTLVQVEAPSPSSIKNVKPPVKPKKKGSPLDDLRRDPDALFALLKCAEDLVANRTSEGEESKASSEAFVANNPYFPYDQELFGHDEGTPDLGDV
ncbi:hypothetical protein SO802_010270 [Lithocarpus litseifolius]|uniref:Uncharacterized protein n=1 Tax=Lithocarpus litseifolius TaxID=425828 RepID=A0AAW2DGR9_9ROSI